MIHLTRFCLNPRRLWGQDGVQQLQLNPSSSDYLSSLVLAGMILPRQNPMHNFGVALDLRLLFKEQMAVMVKHHCVIWGCMSGAPVHGLETLLAVIHAFVTSGWI